MTARAPATDTPARSDLPVHLALLAVQMSFGAFHVVGKALLADMEPLVLAAVRVVAATPILLLLAWRHDRCLPSRSDLPALAGLGLLGVALNQVLFILGLEHTTATNAAILMSSIPVFTVAVAAVLGIERIGGRRLSGISLAVVGALIVLGPGQLSRNGQTFYGNVLILLNCLSYSAFLVLQRPVLRRLPWRTTIAWSFLFGGTGVVAVATPDLAGFDLAAVSGRVWMGIAYIIALPTIFSYSVNTWAVQRCSPALAAAYTTAQPLFAATLASIFLGETLGWRQGTGFLLIAAGLTWVSRRSRRPIVPDHE